MTCASVAIVVVVANAVELVLVVLVEVVLVEVVLVEVVVVTRVVDVTTLVDVLEADDTVVEADESPELLQAPSAAIIMAAEAAAFHALLMATPPFGGC